MALVSTIRLLFAALPAKRARPKWSALRVTRGLICALLLSLIGLATPAVADDPGQLKLGALIQEGDLILEEAVRLDPETEQVLDEGERLDAVEKSLRADSAALDDAIKKHNTAMTTLDQEAKEIRARCPYESEDVTLVDACNTSARSLASAADHRAKEGADLEEWQQSLNQQITRQNAAKTQWTTRKQESDTRVALNRGDLKEWLTRVNAFFASDAFKGFAKQAKNPKECGTERIGDLTTLPPVTALRRAQTCMKAVKARN
jgi:DNA repair exonuclease SbcCD ATPase subunit